MIKRVVKCFYISVRPELSGCGDGKQDNSPSLGVWGAAGDLQTSPLGSAQQIPGARREHWGGRSWWSWGGGGSSSNATYFLHAWSRRAQSPGNDYKCLVIDSHSLRRPSRLFLTLDWEALVTCLSLILSPLQPVPLSAVSRWALYTLWSLRSRSDCFISRTRLQVKMTGMEWLQLASWSSSQPPQTPPAVVRKKTPPTRETPWIPLPKQLNKDPTGKLPFSRWGRLVR